MLLLLLLLLLWQWQRTKLRHFINCALLPPPLDFLLRMAWTTLNVLLDSLWQTDRNIGPSTTATSLDIVQLISSSNILIILIIYSIIIIISLIMAEVSFDCAVYATSLTCKLLLQVATFECYQRCVKYVAGVCRATPTFFSSLLFLL